MGVSELAGAGYMEGFDEGVAKSGYKVLVWARDNWAAAWMDGIIGWICERGATSRVHCQNGRGQG
jgi:hypothetical protein